MVHCPNPSCTDGRIESDPTSGNAFCNRCGAIVEENAIVSEITFGESSVSGKAIVQGSFVSGDATGARIQGPHRNQSSESSHEQTIRKGRQRVNALANAMRLPERYAEQGVLILRMAISSSFIRGRRSQYVVAACLYVVCRTEKTSHMLIDFADMLQINVFKLGSTFLKLVQAIYHNGEIPLVDPSLYITRFAAMLDFGDDTHKIVLDASRLAGRMKRDWIDAGRRPAGVCGACLIIAARMNNYRRSMAEIVHVVKVAESTIQQRLADFSQTDSAKLSVDDFGKLELERSHNPPAFEKAKTTKKLSKGKGSKRRRSKEESSSSEEEELEEDEEAAVRTLATMKDIGSDDAVFKKPYPVAGPTAAHGVAAAGQDGEAFIPSFPANDLESDELEIAQANQEAMQMASRTADDIAMEKMIEQEVAGVLESSELQDLENEELERRAAAERLNPPDFDYSLAEVDDDEIESVMLDKDAVEIKGQVWTQNNYDYLVAQELKKAKAATDKKHGIKTHTKKKRRMKPRDSSAPDLPESAAESARQMLQEMAPSKKINYEAMKRLFEK